MSAINKLSSVPVTYSGVNSIRPHYCEFHFKSGSFKLNFVQIKLQSDDTLDTIVKKFNDKKLITGVSAKKVYIESNSSWSTAPAKIVLVSQQRIVNILDPEGVLSDLYRCELFGTDNKCLLQVIPSERLKKPTCSSVKV